MVSMKCCSFNQQINKKIWLGIKFGSMYMSLHNYDFVWYAFKLPKFFHVHVHMAILYQAAKFDSVKLLLKMYFTNGMFLYTLCVWWGKRGED